MLTTETAALRKPLSGWTGVACMALGFCALYLLNYLLPLNHSSYTTRAWDWTELALAASALAVIARRWRAVRRASLWTGAALGLLSAGGYFLNKGGLRGALTEAALVWACFVAGQVLFQSLPGRAVKTFQGGLPVVLRGVGLGVLLALPLAAVNNLFFWLQNGAPRFQNALVSAAQALRPGIHEEVVFRYFLLAAGLALLQGSARPRLALAAAITLAVVPHSLLHLPDLLLDNPAMALALLAATSLLFGLPMALLQIQRSFESAVAFHWLIDFLRFCFGY